VDEEPDDFPTHYLTEEQFKAYAAAERLDRFEGITEFG
jgi:hypothetical protein